MTSGSSMASEPSMASTSKEGEEESDAGAMNCEEMEDPNNLPPALAEKPAGLSKGKYKLVGWDMDTTGRRLMDELCHIAAYTPTALYAQYIMPYRDFNPGARRRHNLRVVTAGRYRMLKTTIHHKTLKTKAIVAALVDFLSWLEKEKKPDEKIILIYHEPRRLNPTLLLHALNRCDLLDRFKKSVAGFTDSYALCFEKCNRTLRSISLRLLAQLLLDDGQQSVKTALDRATATYKIVEHLANQGEQQYFGARRGGSTSPSAEMMELALRFARPVDTELEALKALQDLLERQNTFRLVFAPLLRCPRPERRRLISLRRILADAGLLYDQLKDAWHEGRRAGLENAMSPLVLTAKKEDLEELVDIFDCHFDPAQNLHYPIVRGPVQPPEEVDELYLTSDSGSSGQVSPTLSFSEMFRGLAAEFGNLEEDEDDDVDMN